MIDENGETIKPTRTWETSRQRKNMERRRILASQIALIADSDCFTCGEIARILRVTPTQVSIAIRDYWHEHGLTRSDSGDGVYIERLDNR